MHKKSQNKVSLRPCWLVDALITFLQFAAHRITKFKPITSSHATMSGIRHDLSSPKYHLSRFPRSSSLALVRRNVQPLSQPSTSRAEPSPNPQGLQSRLPLTLTPVRWRQFHISCREKPRRTANNACWAWRKLQQNWGGTHRAPPDS